MAPALLCMEGNIMGFQEDLMELLAKHGKAETPPAVDQQKDATAPDEEAGDVGGQEAPPAPAENGPDENNEKGTAEMDATPIEKAEFEGPAAEPEKAIVKTPGDMLAEQMEMRFSSFYQAQQELEAAYKLLAADVLELKKLFGKIETAIDAAADASPAGERLESLVNML